MEDATAALAEEEAEQPEAAAQLPEKQEPASRGASGRDAARTAQLDTKPEDAAKEAAAKKLAAADEDAHMAEVSLQLYLIIPIRGVSVVFCNASPI